MNMTPECIPCLLRRILYETELVDPSKRYEVIIEGLRMLSNDFREGVNSAEVATGVHKRTYEIINNDDPYAEMKRKSNEIAKSLYPKAEKLVSESKDSFRTAVIVSIIGNVLDFGIESVVKSPENLGEEFGRLFGEGLAHDDTNRIKEFLGTSKNVLYFTDNCGEIVFDQLLLKEVRKFDVHLTLAVKGEKILTDATMEDVKELNLDRLVDSVMTTNAFAVGVDVKKIGEDLKKALGEADLIISKGMANYESFSDTGYRPIAYLMRTKCRPVAESMGLEKNINAAKLYE